MAVVLENLTRMPSRDWFVQLGDAWSACDNIWEHRPVLRTLLSYAGRAELDSMMSAEERAALQRLPDRITVWRGCYPINRAGLSWTLDREVATGHTKKNRYSRSDQIPLLRKALVRRDRAVLKLDRNEQEVIVTRAYSIIESKLMEV
jgi:hypothetical protein